MTDLDHPIAPEPQSDPDEARANDYVIEVSDLRSQFGDHVVHDGLDLNVRRGEIVAVVGGSVGV